MNHRPQTRCQILDTFPAFRAFWDQARAQPITAQIEAWSTQYIARWPQLRQKLIDCYAADGEAWRAIARDHVFPGLDDKLSAMTTAHDNLLPLCDAVYDRCRQVLGFDAGLICVIYVGIGCGAGWATTYADQPAVLFGLENIAEEGWQASVTLQGLMAHEMGHLTHFHWREQAGLSFEDGPWWQLYSEGFAQRCEHLMQDRRWHMQGGAGSRWQDWCRANLRWLAAEFLRRVDAGEDIRPFFASWRDLRGYKQTGYFLGHELIKTLQARTSLRDVALLLDPATHLRPLLSAMTGQ